VLSWYQASKSAVVVVFDLVLSTAVLYTGLRSGPRVDMTIPGHWPPATGTSKFGCGGGVRVAGAFEGIMSRKMMGTVRSPVLPSTSCVQFQFGSSLQSAEQPSPDRVLPSSHSSSGSFSPSPQGDVHPSVPVQTGSDLQSGEHPSPGIRFPSSHDSSPSATPSPQTVL
jgi:hypothetical protein